MATAVTTATAPVTQTVSAPQAPTPAKPGKSVNPFSQLGFSASVASLALPAATYSHLARSQTGILVLTADDSAGLADGWNVVVQTSAFVYSGGASGADIPAANLSVTSAETPVMTSGQPVDGTSGPRVPSTSPVGTLDTARKLVQANATFGQGTYTQSFGVSFTIPAMARAGVYTGTLTTTMSSTP
ncbi:MAG: hypothetical protein QOF51_3498 [Chloroflexota bacterium]|jgi:hypothetical protein|nr:hypothetical protein [Chloroflexota bacterium]